MSCSLQMMTLSVFKPGKQPGVQRYAKTCNLLKRYPTIGIKFCNVHVTQKYQLAD